MTERRGHVFYHHFAFTLLTTSTWQVSGYSFLTLAVAAMAATCSRTQEWQLLFDVHDFEEPSCIIGKHPRCVAHVLEHPTAHADACVPLAACAQPAATRVWPAVQPIDLETSSKATWLDSPVCVAREAAPAPCWHVRDA